MGNCLNVAFHPLRPDLRAQMDADGVGREGLKFLAERVIEHRLHAGASAHEAGLIQGDVFEPDVGGLFGHVGSFALQEKKNASGATAQGRSELDSPEARIRRNSADTL